MSSTLARPSRCKVMPRVGQGTLKSCTEQRQQNCENIAVYILFRWLWQALTNEVIDMHSAIYMACKIEVNRPVL